MVAAPQLPRPRVSLRAQSSKPVQSAEARGLLFAGLKVSKALTARLLAGPWPFVGNISCWAL